MPLASPMYLKSKKANGNENTMRLLRQVTVNSKITVANRQNVSDGCHITCSGISMIHTDSDYSCASLPSNYCSE